MAGSADQWTVHVNGRERHVRFMNATDDRVLAEVGGVTWSAWVRRNADGVQVTTPHGHEHTFQWAAGERHAFASDSQRKGGLSAPMPGLVLKVLVRPGDKVRAHQTLIVLEAMKMEHNIEAPYDGTVKTVNCAEGGRVAEGNVLIELEQETPASK